MLIVNSIKDLFELKRKRLIKNQLFTYLKRHHDEIHKEMRPYLCYPWKFNLAETGPFFVLESADNLLDLSEAGLNKEDNGIFGAIPEEIRKMFLDNRHWYQIAIVYNNEFLPYFYLRPDLYPHLENQISIYFKKYL